MKGFFQNFCGQNCFQSGIVVSLGERAGVDEKKKKLLKNILLYGGLVFIVLFTVITSIVVNYKRKQLKELKDKNDHVEEVLGEENLKIAENFETFSKNLLNFIDID